MSKYKPFILILEYTDYLREQFRFIVQLKLINVSVTSLFQFRTIWFKIILSTGNRLDELIFCWNS